MLAWMHATAIVAHPTEPCTLQVWSSLHAHCLSDPIAVVNSIGRFRQIRVALVRDDDESGVLRWSDVVELGLNSIEFQQDVQQGFQQSTLHSVWLNALLKIPLNSLLKFN